MDLKNEKREKGKKKVMDPRSFSDRKRKKKKGESKGTHMRSD